MSDAAPDEKNKTWMTSAASRFRPSVRSGSRSKEARASSRQPVGGGASAGDSTMPDLEASSVVASLRNIAYSWTGCGRFNERIHAGMVFTRHDKNGSCCCVDLHPT